MERKGRPLEDLNEEYARYIYGNDYQTVQKT